MYHNKSQTPSPSVPRQHAEARTRGLRNRSPHGVAVSGTRRVCREREAKNKGLVKLSFRFLSFENTEPHLGVFLLALQPSKALTLAFAARTRWTVVRALRVKSAWLKPSRAQFEQKSVASGDCIADAEQIQFARSHAALPSAPSTTSRSTLANFCGPRNGIVWVNVVARSSIHANRFGS